MMRNLLNLFIHLQIVISEVNVVDYLQSYGNLENDENSDINIEKALRTFWKLYNLKADGGANEGMLELMKKLRCGVKDVLLSFALAQD